MTNSKRYDAVTEQMIADQESLIIHMKPDDPSLVEARRRLDELRKKPEPRRILDLTRSGA